MLVGSCDMGLEENEANKLTPLVERGVLGLGGKRHGGKLGRPHSLWAGMVSNLGKYDQRGEEFW